MSTDDSPEREFDEYDSEGLPTATEESTSNLSESETIPNRSKKSMEDPKPSRKPRREVWWLDLGATNHSLKSIGQCFEDRLNWSLLSSSNSLLRHVRSPKGDNLRWDLHQCPGYLREEITLTCDLSKSAIVSHAFPTPSERCSICHQLVLSYTHSDSIDLDLVYCQSTLNNSSSLPPTEGTLTVDHRIDPLCTPNIGVESSDACSVIELPPSLEAHPEESRQENPQQEKPLDIAETINPIDFPVSLVAKSSDVPVEEEQVKTDVSLAVSAVGDGPLPQSEPINNVDTPNTSPIIPVAVNLQSSVTAEEFSTTLKTPQPVMKRNDSPVSFTPAITVMISSSPSDTETPGPEDEGKRKRIPSQKSPRLAGRISLGTQGGTAIGKKYMRLILDVD